MASTYAAYYNISTAQADQSRRASAASTSATSHDSKFSIKSALNLLRPTDEQITPSGIYSPIIKNGPLFQGMKPAEKAQTPTPVYQRKRSLFGRSSKKSSQPEKKHSVTQAMVEGALLRR